MIVGEKEKSYCYKMKPNGLFDGLRIESLKSVTLKMVPSQMHATRLDMFHYKQVICE